jgi:hypothetical protein
MGQMAGIRQMVGIKQMAGIGKRGQNVFFGPSRLVFEKIVEGLAGGQEIQNLLYRETSYAHDGFSAKDFRVVFYAV